MTAAIEPDLDQGYRKCLPAIAINQNEVSLWSVLRQCVGKELSRITMPISFNEPLSFLQRLTECMEYSSLLDLAAKSNDPVKRIEYVTAFAVSGLAANWKRLGKPFNPLLGETYELQRKNYRIICEQISHHPPVSAIHAESPDWTFHGSIQPKLKFWGKSVEIIPKGVFTVILPEQGEAYTWSNVNCCVHNIIVGKLWIEQYGTMEIINHSTGHKSVLTFKAADMKSKELHMISGFVLDNSKTKLRYLYGKWTQSLKSTDIESHNEYEKKIGEKSSKEECRRRKRGYSNFGIGDAFEKDTLGGASRKMLTKFNSITSSFKNSFDLESAVDCVVEPPEEGDGCTSPQKIVTLEVPNSIELWKAKKRPDNSSQFYHFTTFAMSLNELDDVLKNTIAPTDSRLRPDIRLLEYGNIDEAAAEKLRLEEKQRNARAQHKKAKTEQDSRWFSKGQNAYTEQDDWMYSGQYWNRDFQDVVEIF